MCLIVTKYVQQALQTTARAVMKDRRTYKILTACSFMLPINRFYLSNLKGIFLRCITINYFLLGWFADLFYMDKTFDEAMTKRGFANTNIRNEQRR